MSGTEDDGDVPPGLRRAVWQITALFALAALLGVGAVAVAALRRPGPAADQGIRARVLARATVVASLAYQDDGAGREAGPIRFASIQADEVAAGSGDPGGHVVVYERAADGGLRPRFPFGPDQQVAASFLPLARQVLTRAEGDDEGESVRLYGRAAVAGTGLTACAVPIPGNLAGGTGNADVIGVALAVTDPDPPAGDDDRWLLLVAGVVVLLLAGTGRVLAGLAIRPAVEGMRARRHFLAAAAHELRTPAGRVLALTQRARLSAGEVRAADPDPARFDQLMRDLHRAGTVAERTGHTVSNLLTAERIDAGGLVAGRAPVRLDRLVAELEEHHPTVAADVDAAVEIPGDEILLRLALDNLVTNAEQHAAREGAAPTIVVRVAPAGAGAVVEVEDDGPGLPAGVAGTLFDRYRSAGPGAGSGLGLHLVRWVAEAHGGTVGVRTGPEGTTFRLELRGS